MLLLHLRLLLTGIMILRLVEQIPFLNESLHFMGLHLCAIVNDQPLRAEIERRNIPPLLAPEKAFLNGDFPAVLALAAPKAAFIGDFPLRGFGQCSRIHVFVVIILAIGDLREVKAVLQFFDICESILHRHQAGCLFDDCQNCSLLLRGRTVQQECLELLLVPGIALLQSGHIPAVQEHPQQILKIACDGVDIVPEIHGADRKDHLAESRNRAVMDAIQPRTADDLGLLRRAEVALIAFPLQ